MAEILNLFWRCQTRSQKQSEWREMNGGKNGIRRLKHSVDGHRGMYIVHVKWKMPNEISNPDKHVDGIHYRNSQ